MDKTSDFLEAKPQNFSKYLHTLVNKLDRIRSKEFDFSKEVVYSELLRLVRNCENLELDFDLLITCKLAKYFHLAYVMLLEINDSNSLGYQRLLPRLSKVRKLCKDKVLDLVRNLDNKSSLLKMVVLITIIYHRKNHTAVRIYQQLKIS